ncbi:MAG: ActD-like protein [Myxococcota bacterium]
MTRRDTWPDWKLERFLLGDLPEAEAAELRETLQASDELQQRIDALETSNRKILAQYPVEEMASEIQKRVDEESSQDRQTPARSRWSYAIAAVALLAAGVVFGVWQGGETQTSIPDLSDGESVRVKGLEPTLMVFRKTPDGARELTRGDLARKGDLVQVGYIASGQRHGVIASLDGAGVVTLHYPERPDLSTELTQRRAHVLGHAYELDDAPGFERFFFVTSDRPLDVRAIKKRISELSSRPDRGRSALPETPKHTSTYSFLLEKPAAHGGN